MEAWVTFQEARRVFADRQAFEFQDDRSDYGEDRFMRVGLAGGRLVVVAVVYIERDHRIRIIIAKPASRALRQKYEEGPKS
jgi:uncharacterized DUF497 family protein